MSFLHALILILSATAFGHTECRLPDEQGRGSVIGVWEKLPIPLVADRELYRADKGSGIAALKAAMSTWNRWAERKGKVAFVLLRDAEQGMEIPALSACSQSAYTDAVPEAVGIWRIDGTGKRVNRRANCGSRRAKLISDGVQAQTDWQLNGGKIRNASILLNFDYFNKPGALQVDLESLLLHELGHVLGLLHSCNGSTHDSFDATTSPACAHAPKEFVEAAMFPYLRKGAIRREIQQNDLDRINCFY
jgi:hypothetical protein